MGKNPEILWINHASFQIRNDEVSLVTDPWFEGLAFDSSWSLISKTRFDYDQFKNVTHIWLSHEHPDHFSPAVLKKIAPEHRKKITVLYQGTRDGKIKQFCAGLGFREVKDLNGGWEKLSENFQIWCEPWDGGDSWIAFNVDGKTILNLNDCVVSSKRDARSISAKINLPIDVLLTQFSYATWCGNQEDNLSRRNSAAEKLQRIKNQVEIFKPSFVIPFASYIYFCHEDNFYMNDEINHPRAVARFIEKELHVLPVILYPGEHWDISPGYDSAQSIEKYEVDFSERIKVGPTIKRTTVDQAVLLDQGRKWLDRIRRSNPLFRFLPLAPVRISVPDLNSSFQISRSEIKVLPPDEFADVSMYSDALSFCFQFPWGMNTIKVAGKFRSGVPGSESKFFKFFAVSDWNNRGEYVNLSFFARKIPKKIMKKMFSLGAAE